MRIAIIRCDPPNQFPPDVLHHLVVTSRLSGVADTDAAFPYLVRDVLVNAARKRIQTIRLLLGGPLAAVVAVRPVVVVESPKLPCRCPGEQAEVRRPVVTVSVVVEVVQLVTADCEGLGPDRPLGRPEAKFDDGGVVPLPVDSCDCV